MKSRKKPFTFIEILVVMALLVLLLGVAGVSVNSLVNEQRFKSGVHMIREKLLLAQQLMLIQKSDIQLVFQLDPKTKALIVDLHSGKKLSKGAVLLLDKTRLITGVGSCVFNSEGKQENLPFTINFNATEHKISTGTLLLYNTKDPKEATLQDSLTLTGQVSPFGAQPDKKPFIINTQLYFPKEVLEAWSTQQEKDKKEEKKKAEGK